MIGLIMANGVLLALIILIKTSGSRWLGSNTEEKITIFFYGFKKSLASGITTAKILFLGHAPGAVVLPLMIFQKSSEWFVPCWRNAIHYAPFRRPLPPKQAILPVSKRIGWQ